MRIDFPSAAIGLVLLLRTGYEIALLQFGLDPSPAADGLYKFAFAVAVAVWIECDRRSRKFAAPFEFAAFAYFLWPVITPWYLFRTRRWKGLALTLALFASVFLPPWGGYALYLLLFY